jgi:hypothetical protein
VESLLEFFAVPLAFCMDEVAVTLEGRDQVLTTLQDQIDRLILRRYSHSEVLSATVTPLNRTTFLYRGRFVRRRDDGTEIARLGGAYLVTDGPHGRRIAALIGTAD